MAPKVDFYILASSQKDRSRVLCQIIEKAYKKKCCFYVQVNDDSQAGFLNDYLWTFRAGSFIPHAMYRAVSREAEPEPVLIGTSSGPESHCDVLFNYSSRVPEGYRRYARIIEILDEAEKQEGRRRYQIYRSDGCRIETHNL